MGLQGMSFSPNSLISIYPHLKKISTSLKSFPHLKKIQIEWTIAHHLSSCLYIARMALA